MQRPGSRKNMEPLSRSTLLDSSGGFYELSIWQHRLFCTLRSKVGGENLSKMPVFLHQRKRRAVGVMQHASADKRFKILEAHIKRLQYRPDALIEVLHKAQNLFGFLDNDLLLFVAYRLKVPTSRVYGVATFYHFFSLKPPGKHSCVICLGTACYVKGADRLLAAVQGATKIQAGQTTPDNQISLVTARCLGACSLAPVAVYDGSVAGSQTSEGVLERLKGWTQNAAE